MRRVRRARRIINFYIFILRIKGHKEAMSKARSGSEGHLRVFSTFDGADLSQSRRHSSSGIAYFSKSSKGSFSLFSRFNIRKALGKVLGRKSKTKDRLQINEISVSLLREWQNSFSALLDHPDGLDLFEGFLVSEFSEENIQFWKACERYKTVPDHMLEKEATVIYEEYIAPQAPKLVNIDYQIKMDIMDKMKSPDRSCFTGGQYSIYMLMHMDGFVRFVKSGGFQLALGKGRRRSV